MGRYIMALDQGTTSSRCILFDKKGDIISKSSKEYEQIYPKEGWVEHNPMEIWSSQLGVAIEAMAMVNVPEMILKQSELQIREKRQLYGIKRLENLYTMRLCGSAEEQLIRLKK